MKNRLSLAQLALTAERLRGLDERARSDTDIQQLLAGLVDGHLSFGFTPGYQTSWIRARKLGQAELLKSIYQVIYPPNPANRRGRANRIGSRVLYAASNKRVALDEINAEPGDRIAVITIRQRVDRQLELHLIGEIESICNRGTSLVGAKENEEAVAKLVGEDQQDLEQSLLADSILSELFRDPRNHYKAASLFAAHNFAGNHGLVYPSVRTQGGINIAITADQFDACYEVLAVEELVVNRYNGNSSYENSILRESCDVDTDGEIRWDSSRRFPYHWSIQGGVHVAEDYAGWRRA